MNRRDLLGRAGVGAAALAAHRPLNVAATYAETQPPPNIIFIMTDDQAPWAWGLGGHPDARTPNLDRLCGEGANIPNYFNVCPVCSPSRASFLSSRYPTETGVTDILSKSADPSIGLDPNLPAWPRCLQKAGYRTALFGKWHCGSQDPYLPARFGYDEFAGWRRGAGISKDPPIEIDGEERQFKGYTPDILTNFAADFIETKKDVPFLLSLHLFAPHLNTANRTPDGDRTWLPLSEADWGPFRELEPSLPKPQHPRLDVPRAERLMREYLASVHAVDRNLGRLLDTLDRLGLAKNTIVVFTSDNGFNIAHNGIWQKGNGQWLLVDDRSLRTNMYDNSLKSPAVIRWPAAIQPGTVVEATVSNLDWFPTLLATAAVPLPKGAVIRGRDILALLRGEREPWDNDFFAQYQRWEWLDPDTNLRAYRTREWKLVREFNREGKDEFYHIAVDPNELDNLIDSDDPEVCRMRRVMNEKLRGKMEEVNDPGLKISQWDYKENTG